jgi:hypothetical protein
VDLRQAGRLLDIDTPQIMMEINDIPENPEKKPFESIRDAVETASWFQKPPTEGGFLAINQTLCSNS